MNKGNFHKYIHLHRPTHTWFAFNRPTNFTS